MVNFFKKWYFYVSILVHWLIYVGLMQTEPMVGAEYIGSMIGSFIVITVTYGFFWCAIKGIKWINKK